MTKSTIAPGAKSASSYARNAEKQAKTRPPEHTASTASTACRDESPVARLDPWPAPLDQAAYHGLAGDIVTTIAPHTEADDVAILSQTLVAFGNVIGRTSYFRAEADRHHANLFVTLVGNTAKGRKGTSAGRVNHLYQTVDSEWTIHRIVSGLSSGEGLIHAVRDPTVKQEPMYEGKGKNRRIAGYQQVMTDDGVKDKRLLVLESEFSSVLKVAGRERNTVSAIIRQAWDTGKLRTLTKNSPAVATDAHISIVGHITRDELRRQISGVDMANELANRFLWLCVRRSKCLPEGGSLLDRALEPLIERLVAAVEFAQDVGEVKRDDEAREIWRTVYAELSEGKPGLLGAATSRAEAQVMRLAMLYALLDQSDLIGADHLTAALAFWTYAEQSARYIFGSALGDPTADEILAELRRCSPNGMTRDAIRERFHRNKPSAEISRALAVLYEYHLVRFAKNNETGGRPAEVWYASL